MKLKKLNKNNKFNQGIKISLVTLGVNILLTIFKIFAGLKGKSNAMLADGVHTLSDVLTTLVVIFGLIISSKEADNRHPYGHGKFELIFSKILSVAVLGTGILIAIKAIQSLNSNNIEIPGKVAVIASIISIIGKEIMYRITIQIAKNNNSVSLEASAWHHRSDVYSSIGVFIGIIGSRLGLPILDPIAGIIVGLIIIKVGIELYIKSVNGLVDESASKDTISKIKNITLNSKGVKEISDLRTRDSGSEVYIDLSIKIDGNINIVEGHKIAENVKDSIESNLNNIKNCMIHIEPIKE